MMNIMALCLVLLVGTGVAQQPTTTMELAKILPVMVGLLPPAGTAPEALLIKSGDRVAFIGDSITAYGGYVRLTAYVLKMAYPEIKLPQFISAGVSGQKAEGMEPRFEKDMQLTNAPTWIFISVGINDVMHRLGPPHDPAVLAAYQENVTRMVVKAQKAGAKVVLLAPTIIQEDPATEGNKRLTLYVEAMQRIAIEKKCGFVDLHGMFLEALARKPAGLKLTIDGVHMGPYGDSLMAIGVLRALGVPDAKIASIDLTPIMNLRLTMPVERAAKELEVPLSRLFSLPGIGFSL
ncbi:MAG: SGNH/GDSL hydrolase family protein [bacterium]